MIIELEIKDLEHIADQFLEELEECYSITDEDVGNAEVRTWFIKNKVNIKFLDKLLQHQKGIN